MTNPLIAAYLAGCLITTGVLGSYLIQRKRFKLKIWFSTALLATGIGAIFTLFLCEGTSVFSSIVALAIAVIFYLSPQANQNEKIEQLIASTLGGILIGMVSLIGFLMCC